jgi:hypothetical protein
MPVATDGRNLALGRSLEMVTSLEAAAGTHWTKFTTVSLFKNLLD